MKGTRTEQFNLNRIKVLKVSRKLTWLAFTEQLNQHTGLSITPRHLIYCISANSIHTSDLSAIAQAFDVPLSYFIEKTSDTLNGTKPSQKRAKKL